MNHLDTPTAIVGMPTALPHRIAQKQQAATLVEAVAGELAWDWTTRPMSDPSWTIESPASGWRIAATVHHGRLTFEGLHPHGCDGHGRVRMPKITVGVGRAGSVVVAEIRRRLLPGYEKAYESARAAKAGHDARRATCQANRDRLAAILPRARPQPFANDSITIYTDAPQVRSVCVQADGEVQVHLNTIPVDLAATILAAIASAPDKQGKDTETE